MKTIQLQDDGTGLYLIKNKVIRKEHYKEVSPAYFTLKQARELLKEKHKKEMEKAKRGLRIGSVGLQKLQKMGYNIEID